MSLKVSHVLINVDYLSTVLLNQSHEALNQLGEFRMLFLNSRLILLILAPYVSEKLLQVLRIIHDQLVDNCFVKIDTWKFIGVTFDDYCNGIVLFEMLHLFKTWMHRVTVRR